MSQRIPNGTRVRLIEGCSDDITLAEGKIIGWEADECIEKGVYSVQITNPDQADWDSIRMIFAPDSEIIKALRNEVEVIS